MHLVGGGPGHDGLITVRGRRLLATADVVVVDRLAPRGLLESLSSDVEVIDCGKTPGHHQLTQDQINAVIVERALQGLDVVRLKGGDPFVLGRGGEEALACHAAGVPVEVVPGVTSAVSVPAAAGIPVTHRGITSSFALVSAHDGLEPAGRCGGRAPGHDDPGAAHGRAPLRDSARRWSPQAGMPRRRSPWSSAAGLPQQRTTVGTLATSRSLPGTRRRVARRLVVGDVVRMRAELGPLSPEAGPPDGS